MNSNGHRNPWPSFKRSKNNGDNGNAQSATNNGLYGHRLNQEPYTCLRCQRDKNVPKIYSAQNDMDPGRVPSCLEGMTQIEEMLIARACPIMTIYRKHGGQRGYAGHVLNLSQNIQQFINKLPPRVSTLPVLHIKRTGSVAQLRVRRDKILQALLWLPRNNRFYNDIVIDFHTIMTLPVDGITDDITTSLTRLMAVTQQHHR